MSRWSIAGPVLLGVAVLGADAAPAPVGERPVRYRGVYLEPDPQARVVAAAIRFPVGSADDPSDLEGTAALLGLLLQDEANRRVVEYGAAVEVQVRRDETLVSLVAVPGEWTSALETLGDVLYDAVLPEARLTPVREELLEILVFESGAPVRAFELERSRFLRGPGDPGSRPVRGTLASVELLRLTDLEDYRRAHLLEENGVLAVTGPVSAEDLGSVVSGPVRVVSPGGEREERAVQPEPPAQGDSLRVGFPSGPATDLPPPTIDVHRAEGPLEVPAEPIGTPAWSVGDRSVVDRQLTSTWMAVAFPFPRGTPDMLLEFVGHLVLESLTPSPPDPGLYGAEVGTQRIADAPVLVVTVSVDPRITSRWEDRLTSSLDSIAASPPQGSFFDLARRRFRSELLLELAVPEYRARWLASTAADAADSLPDPASDVWRIRRESVADAAAAAGPSRTILYGPVQMMDR